MDASRRSLSILFKNAIDSGAIFTPKSNNTANAPIKTERLRIAIIGQSMFAAEVYKIIVRDGHSVVGVFTIPDEKGKEDPLASIARENRTPLFKIKTWQVKGMVLHEVLEMYKEVNCDLNVLPFCLQFIPHEIITMPKHKSISFHPALLPLHRGVSAINWTLIEGDKEAGFTILWSDGGLDTGPILLQKKTNILPNDTVDSLYCRFLYPDGILGISEAVHLIAIGTAPKISQTTDVEASIDPSLNSGDLLMIKWSDSSKKIHNFIRGLDSSPGARGFIDGKEVRFYGSSIWRKRLPRGKKIKIEKLFEPAIKHSKGLLVKCNDGKFVNIERLNVNGKMIYASKYGDDVDIVESLTFNDAEKEIIGIAQSVWKNILKVEVLNSTDFFLAGGVSIDVVKLIEDMKDKVKIQLETKDVYMATTFEEFSNRLIMVFRAANRKTVEYDGRVLNVNNLQLRFPKQIFINGEFVNSSEGKTFNTINPTDEAVICKVQSASAEDVNQAVEAAVDAFEDGEWSRMSARDRGNLMFRLADILEEQKEALATLETIDTGALYSDALTTHVGKAIEAWRYFAGWTDKIQGSTIPTSNALPHKSLTLTKREPIGVCAIVTPWNFPFLTLSRKMAACLAAGNTVIVKPAEATPLTALKLAELSVLAGFPPGVINVVTGPDSLAVLTIVPHPLVQNVNFAGRPTVGQSIMKSAAESHLKKISLELGGKSPLIIFSDANLERAASLAIRGAFFNKGENNIAAGRIFVDFSIHDKFIARVMSEARKIVIGDPLESATNHGPQNHKIHLYKLLEYVQKGKYEGANLVYGGERVTRPGFFFTPAIFTEVNDDMFIAREEANGPIMLVSKFEENDLEDIIYRANNQDYGLAAGILTSDINRALYLAEKIEAGTIYINTFNKTDVAAPFGGFKQSGRGKDLGEEAVLEYLRTKCITIEY